MKIYQFEGTPTLPSIYLDKDRGIFEIKGTSFPEDSISFYQPVFDWLRDFEKFPGEELKIVFYFKYCNTSSSKVIQNFFEIFQRIFKKGIPVQITWYYDTDDEDIYEAGLGYAERVTFPVELVAEK
ncbi:MAG TPA: DUF1987 domain-containing protein [Salinivirgaceae bacterium]|nr:DUF1987 domain-containing protein [Salinivirgaceae bacterium]